MVPTHTHVHFLILYFHNLSEAAKGEFFLYSYNRSKNVNPSCKTTTTDLTTYLRRRKLKANSIPEQEISA